ncbi:hypothetical protein ACTOB_005403 [Actinoplanes oblitus]|uniref:Fibronectin type-III domain-containing protein n=1 Tax=Actinoplanes oblitus TaxID=3040509 RepID=A0ABY8W6H3_9ACTN|nr:hypothetical protein [Actinoplanes oblitus]WIM93426.1 hypothetical protein ACTOB_005403 [Actinoplanes oblitus]
MPTDWEKDYKATVLVPAREAGNVLPEDLFVRYGINGAHRDGERFDARVAETVRYWKKLSISTKLFKGLADALLAAHATLAREEALNHAEFTRRRAAVRAGAAERLDAWIATVAAGIPYVTRAAVAHLADLTGGLFTEDEVRAKLREAGVRPIDPDWDVPAAPPVGNAVALATDLRLLGYRISPQVVFGAERVAAGFRLKDGFRLDGDGSRLTPDRIEEAKAAVARRARDSRQTAETNVLTILLTAAEGGTVDRLVRWEAAQIVHAALAKGMPAQLAADLAAGFGLDRTEALELTVTLLAGGAPAAPVTADENAPIVAALAARRLREAQVLLAGLGEDTIEPDLRDRVRRLAAEVAREVADADTAERDGRTELAAERLTRALALAQDDTDLAARLGRIAPPPPGLPRIAAGDAQVTVRWTASPATVGEIRYRVLRNAGRAAVGPDDGDLVAETAADTATDPAPPVAEELTYAVFAIRGTAVSAGAVAPPLTLLPPVTGLHLAADGVRVTGSWTVPPGVVDVIVTRAQAGTGDRELRIPARPGALTGFADDEVVLGAAYDYRVVPVYLSRAGVRHEGPGTAGHVVVERPPAPVTDLTAEILPAADRQRLRLCWTVPDGGRVEIRSAGTAPPWPSGTDVPESALDGYGDTVPVVPRTGPDGRAEATIAASQGRVVLTAVTRGQGRAVLGSTVSLELSAMLTGLVVRRRWDTVRVNWLWPEGVQEAVLRWSTATSGDELICNRREVQDDGGVRLQVGPQAVTVAVYGLVRQRHRQFRSPPVVAEVPARVPRVTWWLDVTGLPGFRRTLLRLRADQFCEAPELILVAGAPDGSAGAELVRLPARRLPADRVVEVDVSRSVAPDRAGVTTCVPADPETAGLLLINGGR